MTRRTKKYNAARLKASELGNDTPNRELLYSRLESEGYNWSPKTGTWDKNNPRAGSMFEDHKGHPTGALLIRVQAHPQEIGGIIEDICDAMKGYGYRVYQKSDKAYDNRRGVGVRVYLEGVKIND